MQAATALSNDTNLALLINNIRARQLSLTDWQTDKLNFVPLRGSWFANTEADFDLDEQIDKFIPPQNNKKVMLLMGDSGAGKSLYTQGLVNKLWQNFSVQSPVPIWISLPSLKDPVNKIIEETFEKYGFNADQIEELRKTRSFLFIFDAYDEIRCEKNLFQTNNLDKWNAKIIITCRREYLYHKDNYKLFFAPFIGDKIQYSQYEEIYVRPFNVKQIQIYVQQFARSQMANWKEPVKYITAIEEITGLKELIKTPFILKLTMEVLPQIVEKYANQNTQDRKKVTQTDLYDVFIEQWFIRQEQKLKQANQIKENEDIKPEFLAYAKELALEMHKANLTLVNYNANEESDLFNTEVKENLWAKFFTPKNPRIQLLRTACLIMEVNKYHYAFIHSSLIEYFLTRNLYEQIMISNPQLTEIRNKNFQEHNHATNTKNVPIVAPSSVVITNNQINPNLKEDYFNQRLIVRENNTLQFLSDRVSEQETFKKSLFDRIYSSRNNPANKVAAANAISILNRAKIAFSGMDLSQVQIPHADLSNSICHFTNFAKSDLSDVSFQQSYLCNVDMSESVLENIEFGQLPFFKGNHIIYDICYSKDGRYIAIANGKEIILWDPQTGTIIAQLKGHTEEIRSVSISPDGKLLATGGIKSSVHVWEVVSKQSRGILCNGHISSVLCVSFSPDGKVLASGSADGTVCLWDVERQILLGQLSGHKRHILSIAFSPDSKILASGSRDRTIHLWDVKHQISFGQPLEGHSDCINSLSFSPDGKLLASGSDDKTVCLWEIASHQAFGQPLNGHTKRVNCIAFSPNNKLFASGSDDNTIRLWEIECKKAFGKPLLSEGGVRNIAFSPNGETLVSRDLDENVCLWKIDYREIKDQLVTSHKDINELILSLEGKKSTLEGWERNVYIWQLELECRKQLLGNMDAVSTTLSHDGRMFASGNRDTTIQVWDIEHQRPFGDPLRWHTNEVNCVAFSPDNRILASGGEDGIVYLCNLQSSKQLGFGLYHDYPVTGIRFSSDGKLLASGDDTGHIRLWEIERLSSLGPSLSGHKHSVTTFCFSHDNKLLASGGYDKSIRLWDLHHRVSLGQPLIGHKSWIVSVDFNLDSKLLVSGSDDKTVRLWQVNTQECLHVIYRSIAKIQSVAFSHDGHYLAVKYNNDFALLKHFISSKNLNCYCLIWQTSGLCLFADEINIINVKGLSDNNLRLLTQMGAKVSQQALVVETLAEGPEKPEPKKMIEPLLPPSVPKIKTALYSTANPHTVFQHEKSTTSTEKTNFKNKHMKEKSQQEESEQERKEKCLIM